ncbi:GNAT family N-acetyltransferase [Gorillibacterium timonense]|uniref:GNAT family N-acetyltransferase n=1 Tax=Gorillibacterium timonense TaxID=1689269 RepID=UPI00071D2821|nr:GNAT family N-acetyltransferase [Gorillibacterium timonense]
MSEIVSTRKLTQEEFTAYRNEVVEKYCEELVGTDSVASAEEARAFAETEVSRLLPVGVDLDCLNLNVMVNDKGEDVGFLWHEKRHILEMDVAFIYDILVYENHRKKGYGQRIIAYLAEAAKKEGLGKIVLNVFAKNAAANALYERMGFEVIAEAKGQKAMIKHL